MSIFNERFQVVLWKTLLIFCHIFQFLRGWILLKNIDTDYCIFFQATTYPNQGLTWSPDDWGIWEPPHSSTLAWKIPWMEEPGRLQSMGSLSRIRLSDFIFTFYFHASEKKMATRSSALAWRIPGTVEPDGLPSMELHRVRHDWSNLAAAALHMLFIFPLWQTLNNLVYRL